MYKVVYTGEAARGVTDSIEVASEKTLPKWNNYKQQYKIKI